MKRVAGGLRLDLAAFRELEAFAQLGTELDAATQSQLDRGYRMVELLKQPQYQPLNEIDQVLSIFAGTQGYLDKIPVNKVAEWEKDFLEHVHGNYQAMWDKLAEKKDLDDELTQQLRDIIEKFNAQFMAGVEAAGSA